jgi:polysaccharide biosynthesis protein PslG
MLGHLRKPTVALALGLCGLACLSQTAVARPAGGARLASSPPLGGVNAADLGYDSRPAEADRDIAAAKALNAKIVRAELPWSVLEPRGANQLDPRALAYTDRLMSAAAAHGIRVIALVDSTPCWASAAPAQLRRVCVPGRRSAANKWPPARPADYAAVVGYLAQRYGNAIAALEVWNEPDQANEAYFAGPQKPQRYAAILTAAYAAVKQADPNISVLAGSLVGSNGAFLRLLYAAGIKGHYDGLAVHFYTLTLASVRAIRTVQVANGDTAPLWLDEFGWTSCYPRQRIQQEQACVTAAVQARNITNVFRALSGSSYVAADTLYQMQDGRQDQFGVLSRRGSRKPAFAALARVLASPVGSQSRVTLRLRRVSGRVVASGSAPVGDFMQLEASRGGLPRYRALFTLDRFNHYSISLPRVLGTHGLQIRVYQYWAGPGRAARKGI